MNRLIVLIILLSFFSVQLKSQLDSIYIYTPDEQNVVASAIEGVWMPESDEDNGIEKVTFIKDVAVLDILPKKYLRFLKDKPIYFAGFLTLIRNKNDYKFPCLLTTLSGNPHLVFFRDRNNEVLGDSESFNLFIARKKDKKDDVLFIGGDFNGEPFVSYKRGE